MKLLDKKGYLMICEFEGLSLKPYLCPAKIPTIGYGNTHYSNGKKVTLLDKPITKIEAFEMFKTIADKFGLAVSKCLKKEVNQNQFNALVSFAYNVGVANFMNSTLLKKVNVNPNNETIFDEFCRWNKVGKKEVAGLTKRRNYEAVSYFS
jgi:lysozyme